MLLTYSSQEVDESSCSNSQNASEAAPMSWRINNDTFLLNQFHFHSPSEHVIEGTRYGFNVFSPSTQIFIRSRDSHVIFFKKTSPLLVH